MAHHNPASPRYYYDPANVMGSVDNSIADRLIANVQTNAPGVWDLLDLMGSGPFSVVAGNTCYAPPHNPGAQALQEESYWHATWGGFPWDAEVNPQDEQAIDLRTVWTWAATAEHPEDALAGCVPWTQRCLAKLGDQARRFAVDALLDDRWGLREVFRCNNARGITAVWDALVTILDEAFGPWPSTTEGLADLQQPSAFPRADVVQTPEGERVSPAHAWVARAFLNQILVSNKRHQEAWTVPVITEHMGSPALWNHTMPKASWSEHPLALSVTRIPVLAECLLKNQRELAIAMVQAGADVNASFDVMPQHTADRIQMDDTDLIRPMKISLVAVAWRTTQLSMMDAIKSTSLDTVTGMIALLNANVDRQVCALKTLNLDEKGLHFKRWINNQNEWPEISTVSVETAMSNWFHKVEATSWDNPMQGPVLRALQTAHEGALLRATMVSSNQASLDPSAMVETVRRRL